MATMHVAKVIEADGTVDVTLVVDPPPLRITVVDTSTFGSFLKSVDRRYERDFSEESLTYRKVPGSATL